MRGKPRISRETRRLPAAAGRGLDFPKRVRSGDRPKTTLSLRFVLGGNAADTCRIDADGGQ